jgi:putative serine protease PepD
MDPAGPGPQRGFRAPDADPAGHSAASAAPVGATPPTAVAPDAEQLISHPQRPSLVARTGRPRAVAGAGVLVVAMVIIAALAFRLGSGSTESAAMPTATPDATPASATPMPVTDLYQQVVPSVVMITTTKGSLGSGVIVNDTGLVLTAHHVVAGGGHISILFADGTRSAAVVAAANPKSDIATLTPGKLPELVVPAVLGGAIAVGSDVVAIGNPLGLRDSASTGIVSGLGRTTKTASGAVPGLIQFDAAVNPGSSGGPLLNDQGLVVGVVVSIADPGKDDAFAGIGFAVPIGTALAGGDGAGPGPGGPRL